MFFAEDVYKRQGWEVVLMHVTFGGLELIQSCLLYTSLPDQMPMEGIGMYEGYTHMANLFLSRTEYADTLLNEIQIGRASCRERV